MKAISRFARDEAAQAVVETAIAVPLLLLLLAGSIDVGRLSHDSTIVANSARAGVQYGAQNLVTAADSAGMQRAAKADAPTMPSLVVNATDVCTCADGTPASCTPTACPTNHRLLYVSVTSSTTFHTLFRYLFIPSSRAVTRTETMQVAQ